jgi:lipopolysaccharide export system permease protein
MPPRAIDRYILAAVAPYVALSAAILSIIILVQQTTKFAEVLGSTGAPLSLTIAVTINLLPNILIFTLPMSVLVGIATGFGRMGQDSELIAMRAAGVGTLRLIAAPLLFGVVASLLTLYVGFVLAPASAQSLRDIALRAALYRLESPVEPRSFYTGMPGKVIYVREGDQERGSWEKIFIHWQEPDGQVRLVTARSGRLDFSGEQTELVLEDALMTTLPAGGFEAIARGEHVTLEHSDDMRVRDDRLNLSRDALTKRIREREPEFDEMDWPQLVRKSREGEDARTRREAVFALNKKLTLGLTPIVFAFFGAGLGLKLGRRGRSHGVLLSLATMLLYYLLTLAGEQLGRAGFVSPVFGSWLAFGSAGFGALLLLLIRHKNPRLPFTQISTLDETRVSSLDHAVKKRNLRQLGLLDKAIVKALAFNFVVTLVVLVSVFLIFTLFELLRFIAQNHTKQALVIQYLAYLLPYTSLAVTPVSTLLAVLATYAVMVRQSEAVAWWASGQSVFRLILPALFFAAFLGAGVWLVQERVTPGTNRRQNALRGMIRTGASEIEAPRGSRWIVSSDTKRIYSYDPVAGGRQFNRLTVFDFDQEQLYLTRIVLAHQGNMENNADLAIDSAEVINFGKQKVTYEHAPKMQLKSEEFGVLNEELNKPAELDAKSLSAYIQALKLRGVSVQPLSVALERKRIEPVYPLIMVLVGAPLAFVFGRRGTVTALCIAVATGLAFFGTVSGLQQVGANGLLPPLLAAWSPALIFLATGIYLLSRART